MEPAIDLNPGDPLALASHSHFLMHTGRQDEAMAQIERVLELDPFNAMVQSFYAQDLIYARRYEEAIVAARKAMSMQPDAPAARTALMAALFAEGMVDESLALERRNCAGDRELAGALEKGYAEKGYAGSERRLADTLAVRFGKPGGVQTYRLANIYLHAGDRDRAIGWLERAYAERTRNMPYIGLHFDSLRADPRFQSLLRRMNLPQ